MTKKDVSRAFAEDGAKKTHIGGQALLEGIMMRGKYNWALAVRKPDGSIYTEEGELASGKKKNSWLYWPVIRGCTAFVESLALGFKTLSIAAEHAFDDEDEEEEFGDKEMIFSMVLGILLAVGLFIAVPAIATNLLVGEYDDKTLAWNIVDGVFRVAIFIFYIWLVGRVSDINRMFCYHGAEHKTIHCIEHGLPLTVENARTFPCLHVRCGTAFLIMVMIIALIVYTLVPLDELIRAMGITATVPKLILVMAVRILLLPVIAGFSYEVTVKWAGSHPESKLVRIVLWPGLQMQRLTTHEPDDSMLECAIEAMKLVLAREEREAAKDNGSPCGPEKTEALVAKAAGEGSSPSPK